MIAANETGVDAGRYLFMPFETNSAGVQRISLSDSNYNTRTTTIVAPGTQGFVSGDASSWTHWGGYLTAEESWGTGSTKGRMFEVTNPTTAAANTGTFVQRTVIPRVSHEGLVFDKNNNLYFVDELNGGSIYKYSSANPLALIGNDFFSAGQTFALKVQAGGQFEGNNSPAATVTGISTWEAITDINGGALAGISTVLPDGTIDGRVTADHATRSSSTGYNRPEGPGNPEPCLAAINSCTSLPPIPTRTAAAVPREPAVSIHLILAPVKSSCLPTATPSDAATGLAAGGEFRKSRQPGH